jgi:hypothetical protein
VKAAFDLGRLAQGARRRIALPAAFLAAATVFTPQALAVWPPDSSPHKQAAAEVKRFLAAARESNYGAISTGDDQTFSAVTRQQFEAFAAEFGSRLKCCAGVSLLGVLKKGDEQIELWKVAFGDGSDDLLMELGMRGDRVATLAAD